MKNLPIIDLHQDLLSHIRFRERDGQARQTDFVLLAESDISLVIATAFPLPPADNQTDPLVNELITEELTLYHTWAKRHGWHIVQSKRDLDLKQRSLLLHVEGLNVFTGTAADWERLRDWQALGLRSVGPFWNIDNALGGGTKSPALGLTPLGYEVVEYIETEGLLLDLAHASRQSFWDIAAHTKRPLLVSHGNAAALCPSPRNYTDDQLRAIANSGGVIGVFAAGWFVSGKPSGTLEHLLAHIDYLVAVMGIDHVALGTDFGGVTTGLLQDFSSVSNLPDILTALERRQYTESDRAKLCHENALRVVRKQLA